jgi:hypothetical protein
MLANRPGRRLLDREAQAGGEADGAQEPQVIFLESFRRLADSADLPGVEVILSADEVDDAVVVERVEE